MRDRDHFDANNLGNFRRSFPNPNCVSGQIIFVSRNFAVLVGYLGSVNEVWIFTWGVQGSMERVYQRCQTARVAPV